MIEIYIIDYKTGRGALRSGRPPGFTQSELKPDK